jgi:hypothetical protein
MRSKQRELPEALSIFRHAIVFDREMLDSAGLGACFKLCGITRGLFSNFVCRGQANDEPYVLSANLLPQVL